MKSFLSIKKDSEGMYKEKGSKFLAFAYPVNSEEHVKEKLNLLKKQFYDARHHCYAYMLGNKCENWRANDDGEPNHSAGDPIMGQIRSRNLTNILVVVVRYFGGTKLGVSGLITAYKTAASAALEHATIIEVPIKEQVQLSFPYEKTSEVMRLMKEFEVEIVEQQFDQSCLVKGLVEEGFGAQLKQKTDLLVSVQTTVSAS